MNDIILKPIGILHSEFTQRYETPRQGVLAENSSAVIELNPNQNFEQAIIDLEGIERIWIIYVFHLNKNWKPMVVPPRYGGKKSGVFATRAPYRPNPIGLSCVRFIKAEGLKIFITESDILDGSPVLDIKPYLPYSDSFPDASTGWIKSSLLNRYEVLIEPGVKEKAEEIKLKEKKNLLAYARIQLEFNPSDISRKRISNYTGDVNCLTLAYRNWSVIYCVKEEEKKVIVLRIEEV